MGKTYNTNYNQNKKDNNKLKFYIPIVIAILIVILIVVGSIIVYFAFRPAYVYEDVAKNTKEYTETEVKSSNPIIIGNILMGSWLQDKWIPVDQYYKYVTDLTGTQAVFFDENGKMADNNLGQVAKDGDCYWVKNERANSMGGYIATTGTLDMLPRKYKTLDLNSTNTDEYTKKVKEVITSKGILNDAVKLHKVIEVSVTEGKIGYIVVASNNGNAKKGVYSTVIYISDNKTDIIKISYNNDSDTINDWGFYDVLYLADINNDNVLEVIIQEVKGTVIKQSILQYKNNKFTEVLSVSYSL